MLFPAKARVALVGLVVAGGAVAAATLGPAGAAVGQSSPPIQAQIQVSSPATLLAKGAGVDVSVTASCSGLNVPTGSIGVRLTEAIGKNLAIGFGQTTIPCTGVAQTVDVRVIAQSGHAFAKGPAATDAGISACTVDFFNCGSQSVEPSIEIGK
jgi:hypothetical protein